MCARRRRALLEGWFRVGEASCLALVCGMENAPVSARRCYFGNLVQNVSKCTKCATLILVRGVSGGVGRICFMVIILSARTVLAEQGSCPGIFFHAAIQYGDQNSMVIFLAIFLVSWFFIFYPMWV